PTRLLIKAPLREGLVTARTTSTPSGRRGISRPSAFALGSQSALYSRTARSSDVQAIEHSQAPGGGCFRFRPQDHATIECGQWRWKNIRIPDEEYAQCSVERRHSIHTKLLRDPRDRGL